MKPLLALTLLMLAGCKADATKIINAEADERVILKLRERVSNTPGSIASISAYHWKTRGDEKGWTVSFEKMNTKSGSYISGTGETVALAYSKMIHDAKKFGMDIN